MTQVTLEQAKERLEELLRLAAEGEEVIILGAKDAPSIKLEPIKRPRQRKLGQMKGKIWIADDFDAPLEDFNEYM